MKTLFKMAFIAFGFAFVGCAQKGNVSSNAKQAFEQKFPNARSVSWEKEHDGEWEAEFKLDGKKYSANFKENGTWLETESEIQENEVPAVVSGAMKAEFPAAKVNEVYKVERQDGISYEYEIKLNGKKQEVIFDSSGTMQKKKAEENEDDENEDDD
ncbi:MAG: PepSY-like domain-containing protein [Salinimicrobium sp.]